MTLTGVWNVDSIAWSASWRPNRMSRMARQNVLLEIDGGARTETPQSRADRNGDWRH
jgi:hypothetical protein